MAKAAEEPTDWSFALAASVVTRSVVTRSARRLCQQAFGDIDLSFILAQGTARQDDGYEAITILQQGRAPDGPLVSAPLPLGPSAAGRAMEREAVVCVTERTPDRDQLADWRQLRAAHGVGWLLAAPLALGSQGRRAGVLGAVLVAGPGAEPSVDVDWLSEWACEMSAQIGHASVQLMESSLEVLSVLFPPRVLERLVSNAARKTGQEDLAEVLRSAALSGGGLAISTASSSARSSFESRAAQAHLPASPQQSSATLPRLSPISRSAASSPAEASGSGPAASPFAAQAARAASWALSPGALSPIAPGPLRQASCAGSVASAVLRQASLRSQDLSFMLDAEAGPQSPHEWELSGYEDLLEEDHAATKQRRPSMALERAHSRPSPHSLESGIAAAAAAADSAGGLHAAVTSAAARATEQAASAAAHAAEEAAAPGDAGPSPAPAAAPAAAATEASEVAAAKLAQPALLFSTQQHDAGRLPPALAQQPAAPLAVPTPQVVRAPPPGVRVPWSPKPLMNPLGSSELAGDPLLSPRKPQAQRAASAPFAVVGGAGSGSQGSSSSSSSSSSLGGPPHDVAPPAAAGKSGKPGRGSGSGGGGQLAGKAAGKGAAAAPAGSGAVAFVRQDLDLSFSRPQLESTYRRWVAPHLQRCDFGLGAIHAAVLASALAKAALHGTAAACWLLLAGLLLVGATVVASRLRPAWWLSHRTAAVAAVRLVATLLIAGSSHAAGRGSAGAGEALLVDSGAVALCLLPLRFMLPLSVHLPVHLLCLWVLTSAAALRGPAAAAAMPLPAVVSCQLALGFGLGTWLAYTRDARLRARFLRSREAAACLQQEGPCGRGKRRQGKPPLSPPHETLCT